MGATSESNWSAGIVGAAGSAAAAGGCWAVWARPAVPHGTSRAALTRATALDTLRLNATPRRKESLGITTVHNTRVGAATTVKRCYGSKV